MRGNSQDPSGVALLMRAAALAIMLVLVACKPGPETTAERRVPVTSAANEPPPHYHDYPEIPADELGTATGSAALDAGAPPEVAASDCPMSEPPPAPAARARRIRSGPPVTNYIPPEVIMRPIRLRARCFRGCYEAGLSRNPKLAGRVAIRFVIDLDGWVRRARLVENEIGDADVSECVRRAFVGLSYPEPEGGEVTVVYPMQFARAD